MKKRKIFSWMIIIGTLMQFILANFIFTDFPGFISFVLLVPFYLCLYLFYQRYKYIKWIGFIGVFSMMGFIFLMSFIPEFPMWSNKIKLMGMFSYFGSLINIGLALVFLLQVEPKNRWIKGLTFFIVISNYLFISYFTFSIQNVLVSFFGPSETIVVTTLFVYKIITYIFQILVMIAQVVLVNILDREDEFYKKAEKN